jgi:hypothetical protein
VFSKEEGNNGIGADERMVGVKWIVCCCCEEEEEEWVGCGSEVWCGCSYSEEIEWVGIRHLGC